MVSKVRKVRLEFKDRKEFKACKGTPEPMVSKDRKVTPALKDRRECPGYRDLKDLQDQRERAAAERVSRYSRSAGRL
jgi:hypothetical protein